MIKSWGAAWALAALIAIVSFAIWLDLSAPYHHCHGPNDCGQASKNDHQPADYMAPALAVLQFVDAHNGAVNAIAAVIIALFTIVLAARTGGLFKETAGLREAADKQRGDTLQLIAATRQAANAAQQSADIARSALLDLEKPYVIVEDVRVASMTRTTFGEGVEKSLITYDIALKNFGRTPALIRLINFEIWPSGHNVPERKAFSANSWSGIEMISITLAASDTTTKTTRQTHWRGRNELDPLINHQQTDIFTIVVTYEDVFGWMHADKFMFYFDVRNPVAPRLVPIATSYSENRKSEKFRSPRKWSPAWSQEWPDEHSDVT